MSWPPCGSHHDQPGYRQHQPGGPVSTLWLIPLAVGAVGAAALARANQKLAHEVQALRRALRPLRAGAASAAGGGRPGAGES